MPATVPELSPLLPVSPAAEVAVVGAELDLDTVDPGVAVLVDVYKPTR